MSKKPASAVRNKSVEKIPFSREDLSSVRARVGEIAISRQGWVNFRPEVDPDDEPREPGAISGIFAVRGPAVPVGTWIPGRIRKGVAEPDSVGLLHPRGQMLSKRLEELGIPTPERWRVVQDDPRKGLVFRVPPGSDPQVAVDWILSACEMLSVVPLTGTWTMEVH